MIRSRSVALPATIETLEHRQLFAANPAVVDVAVVYTPAARLSVGGLAKLTRRVERAVADTNYILANSRVDAAVRLVSLTETSYVESQHLGTDLDRLQSAGDGFLDGVHALRNSTGADLVHLLVADGDDGGRAYQLDDPSQPQPDYGFAVSQARYTNVEYIFAHETMHSLGAGHDDGDTSARNLPYAYAMRLKSGSRSVHTLMGHDARIPFLSNPDLTWRGQRLGMANGSPAALLAGHAADNTRAVRAFLPVVTSNRSSRVSDTAAPAARLVQASVNSSGNTLTVQVALADNTAINVSTLDGADLRVSGPAGFSRAAAFAGVDQGGNGAQRLARYTIDITGHPADASRYGFTLAAGQITDTAGNSVPAGALGAGTASRFADRAGPGQHTAMDLGSVNGTSRILADSVSEIDVANFYRFTLTSPTSITARLMSLAADADLRLVRDANGNGLIASNATIASSLNFGTQAEQIVRSLGAGEYTLWVTPVSDAVTTYALSLSATGAATPVPPPSVPPAAATGSVKGQVWRDNNGNGSRDSWEIGLDGWTVYADVNNNGRFDSGTDPATTTAGGGVYTLGNLPASQTHTIRSLDQSGYRRTTAAFLKASVLPGKSIAQQNFGHTPRVLVSGTVYLDVNGNHVRETSEAGAGGWNVYLDRNGNNRLDLGESWTTTDAQGNYAIKDGMSGSFIVRLVAKPGFKATTTSAHPLTLAAGAIGKATIFGVKRV